MAFLILQRQQCRRPLLEAEELKLKASHSPAEERRTGGGDGVVGSSHVTSRLYLSKSPSDAAASLEKDTVLRRIRHHRRINRVRTAFESILGGSMVQEEPQDDGFSSP